MDPKSRILCDLKIPRDYKSALEKIGYHHEGNLGIIGREAFKYDGKEHLRKHHLYVCPVDSPELKRHIAFRDYRDIKIIICHCLKDELFSQLIERYRNKSGDNRKNIYFRFNSKNLDQTLSIEKTQLIDNSRIYISEY